MTWPCRVQREVELNDVKFGDDFLKVSFWALFELEEKLLTESLTRELGT